MPESAKQDKWEESYQRRENFMFYPCEEILRFLSRHVAKRIGPEEFKYYPGFQPGMRVLDFGCGLGRHVRLMEDFGFEGYGVDHSLHAISTGRSWLAKCGMQDVETKLQRGDGRELPFENQSFDLAISHGVLDSMAFSIAEDCIDEIYRVLKPGALFYLDLISNDDSDLEPDFCGEVVVKKQHEIGTVQSYFNEKKIVALLGERFKLLENIHVQRDTLTDQIRGSRFHVVAKTL